MEQCCLIQLDGPPELKEDPIMENAKNTLSAEDLDMQEIGRALAMGKKLPNDVVCRVRARADEARKQLLAAHGVQDVGVQIIREIRGELPQP